MALHLLARPRNKYENNYNFIRNRGASVWSMCVCVRKSIRASPSVTWKMCAREAQVTSYYDPAGGRAAEWRRELRPSPVANDGNTIHLNSCSEIRMLRVARTALSMAVEGGRGGRKQNKSINSFPTCFKRERKSSFFFRCREMSYSACLPYGHPSWKQQEVTFIHYCIKRTATGQPVPSKPISQVHKTKKTCFQLGTRHHFKQIPQIEKWSLSIMDRMFYYRCKLEVWLRPIFKK